MAPAIEYRGVRMRFGARVVLDGVDLAVEEGEVLALLGPSGAGKTVMLRLVIGLLRADGGELWCGGVDVVRAGERELRAVRRRVGYVFQGGALFDSLTVDENVAYGLRVGQRVARAEAARAAAESLRAVGLPGIGALLPSQLSGGTRKRVAIARALCARPSVLLYDEPTSGLDPANVRLVEQLIRPPAGRLCPTAIVVTHDRELAFAVADRMALLDGGRLRWLGAAAEARRAPPTVLADFLAGRSGGGP
jgi:phospholipid/cholesterol/gamma-HCH transport system ATP-binding protein